MKKKKINCKHGLDAKQEIQARRLRVKLERKDEETINSLKDYYKKWWEGTSNLFLDYLEEENIVMYSALIRSNNLKEIGDLLYNFRLEL